MRRLSFAPVVADLLFEADAVDEGRTVKRDRPLLTAVIHRRRVIKSLPDFHVGLQFLDNFGECRRLVCLVVPSEMFLFNFDVDLSHIFISCQGGFCHEGFETVTNSGRVQPKHLISLL
jgi:hypothetical protein